MTSRKHSTTRSTVASSDTVVEDEHVILWTKPRIKFLRGSQIRGLQGSDELLIIFNTARRLQAGTDRLVQGAHLSARLRNNERRLVLGRKSKIRTDKAVMHFLGTCFDDRIDLARDITEPLGYSVLQAAREWEKSKAPYRGKKTSDVIAELKTWRG